MFAKPTLYHWEPNANSGKPILALEERGVDYDSVYLDLLNVDQHDPAYLRINPMGTIPAMVHEGHLLNESTAIMEYVDARFDSPSLVPPILRRGTACAGGPSSSTSISARR